MASKGCNVIISALNISRKSDFPWSGIRTPHNFLSNVMKNILSLSKNFSFKKIITCSAWGVHDTLNDIPWWFKLLIKYSNIGIAYKEHEKQESILSSIRSVKWTIVRPTGLVNRKKIKQIRISINNEPKPYLTISRKEVALFMLACINEDKMKYQKVVISTSLN